MRTNAIKPGPAFVAESAQDRASNQEEIERLLAGNSPLRKLRPFVGSWETVLQLYAGAMSERYPSTAEAKPCDLCRAEPSERLDYHWVANYDTRETLLRNLVCTPLFLLLGHYSYSYKIMEFTTCHWFCRACARRQFFRQTIAELVTKVSFLCLVLSLFVLVFSSAFLVYLFVVPAGSGELLKTKELLLGSLFGSLLFLWGVRTWRRSAFPRALRGLGKAPFSLVRRKRVSGTTC